MADPSSLQHEEIVRRHSRDVHGRDVHARLHGCCRAAALYLLAISAAQGATFSSVHYDPNTNDLVVTMIYDGTNPNHQFSVQWGACRPLGHDGNHQIAADVLDSKWDDAAQRQFTVTVRFSLAGVNCLPAAITLRTAPKYEYTLQVP
jgi:hypothetical protein